MVTVQRLGIPTFGKYQPPSIKRHMPGIERAYRLLILLELPLIRMIMQTLHDHNDSGLNVIDLLIKLCRMNKPMYIDQSVVSRYLAELRHHRMVYYIKSGKTHTYYINTDKLERVSRALSTFSSCADHPVKRDPEALIQ